MYIKNGIAYADDPTPLLTVVGARAMDGYKLWLRFSDGAQKVCDCTALLDTGVFARLRDKALFAALCLDGGTVTWADGEIDIAPEYLYERGVSI